MGGSPCTIIIIGNELAGNIAGIFESFSEAEPYLTAEEKTEIKNFLSSAKMDTDRLLNRIRVGGKVDVDIITLGAQFAGNLSAICDTATESPLFEEEQEKLIASLDERKKESDRILKLMRERAAKDES